jgi:predicted phage terminase large subunit-like protein
MQTPADDEGSFFKKEWFKRFSLGEEPKTTNYQSTDFATKEDDGDFTELGVFGVDKDNELWVRDWWYGQTTTDVWIDSQLDQYKAYDCFAAFGETGQIRRAVEPFQAMRSRARHIYPRLEWIVRAGDKAAMARSFQGMASSGMVHIPYTDWGDRLIDQLCKFPMGKYDDAVDVCALMAMAIQMAHPAIVNTVKDKSVPLDLWGRPKGGGSWRTS